jgi:hypothetical protein
LVEALRGKPQELKDATKHCDRDEQKRGLAVLVIHLGAGSLPRTNRNGEKVNHERLGSTLRSFTSRRVVTAGDQCADNMFSATSAAHSMTISTLQAQRTTKWRTEPTVRELLLLLAVGGVFFDATAITLHGWNSLVLSFGDNAVYLDVATTIRHWDFHGAGVQHFMGYPYAIAAVSLVLHLPLNFSLWLVAGVASLVSTLLVARLFGTLVAAYFAISNFAWLQTSFLGGSEPLAVALGIGAFLSFRRGYPLLAALLGALATTVRPLMFFTLVGVGVALLYQKRYAKFVGAFAVGLGIGLLYAWPLAHYFGDPLLTAHSYTSRDYGALNVAGPHGHLFGWPFHAIIAGTMLYPAPWTNLILSFSWIALVVAGAVAMFSRNLREFWRANPAEAIFCGLYLLAIFCYDYLVWARGNFMRFSIPVLPFVFLALLRWLPRDRRVLWCLGALAPVLAACSAIGIRNLSFLH